ncbi:kinase-like domain-containing protein [Rhizophagus irregularis DAOM 181602=DAOM 197198]|nr:kinase-like domain-containing protein [Rhizophagus irregularis DAOM 181602=DAOM 197198]
MLNGSQNMSDEYLNELKTHWKLNKSYKSLLTFYGMTKDPETKEFIMITQFAEKGNLRSFLSSYFHKDFHSGNILLIDDWSYISDFGLSGSSNEQKSDNKICGVLPYIAPEVLNGEPYTLSSDIYSFGVIMAELSSGKPPFHKRKHDATLALAICNGLRPEFGKGTPEVYKKLAYSCMNSTPNQRPTANDLSAVKKMIKIVKILNYLIWRFLKNIRLILTRDDLTWFFGILINGFSWVPVGFSFLFRWFFF